MQVCCTAEIDKISENTFTTTGFNNWRKALEKFRKHSLSITHHEAEMKWQQLQQPSTSNRLNSQLQNVQACFSETAKGCINYCLCWQMIPLICEKVDKYMSHEIIMCIMSNNLLRLILTKLK